MAKPHLTVEDQRWLATARADNGSWWLNTETTPRDASPRLDAIVERVAVIGDVGPVHLEYRLTHAGERLLGLKPAPIAIRPWDRPAGWVMPPVNPVTEHAERWAATARRADGPFTPELAARLGYDPADIAAHFDRPELPALPPEEAIAELAHWAVADHGADLTRGRVLILERPLTRGGALVVTVALDAAPQPEAA